MTAQEKGRKKKTKDAAPTTGRELQIVRAEEKALRDTSKDSVFLANLGGMLRPIKAVCDPVLKVCYTPFTLHWEEKYKKRFPIHATKLVVLDIFLLGIIAALITFGAFSEQILPTAPIAPLVRLDLDAPATVVSGEPVDYRFSFTNESPSPIGCVQLTVHLPSDTVVSGALPTLESDGTSCIVDTESGDLAASEARHDMLHFPQRDLLPGESDSTVVRATTYGASGTQKTLRAELTYWEEGKAEATHVSLRRDAPIVGSTFTFDIDTPTEVTRGQTHAVTVAYTNAGTSTLSQALVRIDVPSDFRMTSSLPVPSGRNEWRVGDLAPGDHGIITLNGYFHSTATGTAASPTFSVSGHSMVAGQETLVELARKNADPRASDLSFSLQIVEPANRTSLLPGETVRTTIRYRNDGDRVLRDLSVRLDPGAPYHAPSSGPFSWDGSSDPAMAQVAPGAEGTLTTTIVVPMHITKEALGIEAFPELYLSANASYRLQDDLVPVRIDTAVTHMPISGHLKMDGTAAYYTQDGDQIGTGPLPPKVGATTKYRVILSPSVTSSDVRDVEMTARLPQNVEWTGRTSVSLGGAIDFLPSTRTVRWRIDALPAWTGVSLPPAIATFEVAVTPIKDDSGHAMVMATDIAARGTDGVTGLGLHATLEDVTTEISGDAKSQNKGMVTP